MKKTIYVKILNEGTEVWRPVQALKIENDIYKITQETEFDEEWEFNCNELVHCIVSKNGSDKYLKAIKKAT